MPRTSKGWTNGLDSGGMFRLSTKGKCFLVLALIGLLLGSALLGHKAAFGFFFQRADELLEAQQAAAIGTTANGCQS